MPHGPSGHQFSGESGAAMGWGRVIPGQRTKRIKLRGKRRRMPGSPVGKTLRPYADVCYGRRAGFFR